MPDREGGRETARIDVLTFEHVSLDGPDGPRLVDAHGAVPDRGVTVLAGPSGAGKSTLLRMGNRLDAPDSGRVLLRGEDVASIEPHALRRRVGMVFQRPTPFPGLVVDNLRVAVADLSDRAAHAALDGAGLDASFLERPATELSGGEAQRVCIARTLVTKPEAMLMDEPTSSLDPEATEGIEALARALADSGVPVIWVTHDRDQLRRLADTAVVMRDGHIVATGSFAEVEGALDE